MLELTYTVILFFDCTSAMPFESSKLVPWPESKSYDKQAIPVPGTKRAGQSRMLLLWELII